MTMHLVRGMSSLNNKRRKSNRKPGQAKAQAAHDAWLKKMDLHPTQLKTRRSPVARVFQAIRQNVRQSQRRTILYQSPEGVRYRSTQENTSLDSPQCTSPTLFQWAEAILPKTSQKCEDD